MTKAKALDDVAAERERQKTVEGLTEAHDDGLAGGTLARAAAAFALVAAVDDWDRGRVLFDAERIRAGLEADTAPNRFAAAIRFLLPQDWEPSMWKPKDRRRDLIRAGALILAEIERLDRATRSNDVAP